MRNGTFAALLSISWALCACAGDDEPTAGTSTPAACEGVPSDGCTTLLGPSADDATLLQTAFIEAKSGDSVCLCPGSYSISRELSVGVPNVTIRGLGAAPDDTVLDFAGQSGNHGVDVTSDGFTMENLWIKNTTGNGVVVTGADGVTFRKLKVTWDAGSVVENGAYAVYPVSSQNVLIEQTEVVGAADAGIYVGQCTTAVVRDCKVHGNVAGIEIENTTHAEVYDNESWDNTAGILVFVLPNLEKKNGMDALVHDNLVHDNNRDNFAEPGTIVASVPAGTGMLLLAADNTEIRNNTVENNVSVGVMLLSFETLKVVLQGVTDDPATDPWPEKMFVHDNTFNGNGTAPKDILAALVPNPPLQDVVWDGREDPAKSGAELCLGTTTLPSFMNLQGGLDPAAGSTDTTPFVCTLAPVPPVEL